MTVFLPIVCLTEVRTLLHNRPRTFCVENVLRAQKRI